MPRTTQRRLPFAPLAQLCRGDDGRLATTFGVQRRQIQRWKHDGIPVDAADRAALTIGLHPLNVWGSEWEEPE